MGNEPKDESEVPGTFAWATAKVDQMNRQAEIAKAEYEARLAAERELEERKANPANLTHEEAVEEIKLLRERVSELEGQIAELEEWKREIERAVYRRSDDF